MIHYFCTACWAELLADATRCPACGDPVDPTLTYADKLVRALRAPDGALVAHAAHTLGDLRDPRAVEALEHVVWRGDPYAAAEAVRALAHIGTPAATRCVAAATDHPSVIVRTAARAAE